MKAMAPQVVDRYQHAGDLLADLLAAHKRTTAAQPGRIEKAGTNDDRHPTPAGMPGSPVVEPLSELQGRLKARETPQPRFCWHCRKPLHARSDRCPFCG